MSEFDFDTLIDFRNADSMKWNRYAGRDVLPMWVADMDFASPPALTAALQQRVARGVFGYSEAWSSLIEAVQAHLLHEYAWQIQADWLVWLPGLVTGLNVACRAVGKAGDAVLSATPVYPPFMTAPVLSERILLTVSLSLMEGRWQWDLSAAEQALRTAQKAGVKPRLLLLCHPHNPVGRVWSRAELQLVADFAERHDLIVCSDEIHCDLILEPHLKHIPFAMLSETCARRCITLMAPSKTFNVPGLGAAFAVIPDASLRRQFVLAMRGIVPHVNALGMAACEAAFRFGGPWRAALLQYLRANRDLLMRGLVDIPDLQMNPVEATYLAWIDARELCQARQIRNPQSFFEQAGIGLSAGRDFSTGDSEHYVRLNFACPRSRLEEALQRMRRAVCCA